MNTQNNSSQIIAEKWPLDNIEFDLNAIDAFAQAVKDGIISIDDMQRDIKAALKTFEYYNEDMAELHGRNVIDPFVQAVKDGIISIDEMQICIKAPLKTFEYYNEHMLELHGCHLYPFFTAVRKERTEKE